MRKPLVIAMAAGLAVVAALVAGIVAMQWGAHIEISGQVLKVRTAPIDEHSSAVAIDFRFTNPARYSFVVKGVTVVLEDKSGKQWEGVTISEIDTERLFEGLPLLGRKYNPSLFGGNKIAPHQTEDRMVAARFDLPHDQLDSRRRFLVSVEEVDGAVSEFGEKK